MTSARFRIASREVWFAGVLFSLAVALHTCDAGKDWGAERESYVEPVTGNERLLATGIRDKLRSVHVHASFDRLDRYVQFHTGRTRETVAVIDLRNLPPADWTK